jgi:hypothetical protein
MVVEVVAALVPTTSRVIQDLVELAVAATDHKILLDLMELQTLEVVEVVLATTRDHTQMSPEATVVLGSLCYDTLPVPMR